MKSGITIRYSNGQRTVEVNGPSGPLLFDLNAMDRKQEAQFRKELVRAWKESRE
jgi:hypothetical protein